jgi:hypothetical protein
MATVGSHASVAVGGVNTGVAGHAIGDVCVTHVIVGGVTSWTTIVPLQVALFPQSSVAVHVLVTLKFAGHIPGVVTSEKVMATLGSQASVAVGGVNTGVAGQLIGEVCVTHVIVGGVTSCTTMVPLQVAVFPQSSVAVHVLVTLKFAGQVPGVVTSEKVKVTLGSQASVAVGGINTGVAGQLMGEVCATQVIVGGVTSWTIIVPLQVAVLPQSSVAVHVLVTLKLAEQVPGVVTSVKVKATLGSHASVAVGGVKTGAAGQLIGEVCVTHVIVGEVTSCTTMVPLQVAVFPQSSVAVHVLVTLKLAGQVPGVVTSVNVKATLGSHASVAVGGVNTGVAGQLIGEVCTTQVIVGGVTSCTTMVPLQVAVLPQSSVAVHVLVTLKLAEQVPGVVTSENVMLTLGSHASVAVGGVNTGVAGQLMGEVCATQVIVGGVTSWTTIVPLQVAVLPQSSVAVHVLVTLKFAGQVPGVVTSENVMVTLGSQASVAVGGVNTGVAGQLMGEVCTTQIIVGGVTSCTTMVPLQVAIFPQSSVAVHVLVTLYAPTQAPGVVTSVKVKSNGSQNSVTVGGVNTGVEGQSIGVLWTAHTIEAANASGVTVIIISAVEQSPSISHTI